MKAVLTIAGSDCSGGAGIQADIKTFCAHNKYAMSVICALTAQNTLNVAEILEVDSNFVKKQLISVLEDIKPSSVKIGMISNDQNMQVIMEVLNSYNIKNIVIDPVMIATSEAELINSSSIKFLKNHFLKIADLVTPNIFEAEILSGIKILTKEHMIKAAKIINKDCGCSVLIKGGHLKKSGLDILYTNNKVFEFILPYVENQNTHGTGCTLSSAIACNLASNQSLVQACSNAKKYVHGALEQKFVIGHGNGPLNHLYNLSQVKCDE